MGVIVYDKKYELVPPDGGWGIVVAVAVTINMITISAFLASFGMIYKSLFIELGMDSTSITLLNGIGSFSIAISGLAAPSLLKLMSIRKLGLFAAVIYNLGTFCVIFAKSQFTFFICWALLQGIGHGLIFNLSCTMLSHYFLKWRLTVVSITQTIVALSGLLAPYFVKWSLESYGFKGTVLLISCVYLQNIVAMTLMQPVKWHMKKVEVPEGKASEIKSLLALEEVKNKANKCDTLSDVEKDVDNTKGKCNADETEHQCGGIKKIINTVIDLSIVKSFVLSNACFGMALCIFAEFTYTALLPQALYFMDWTEEDVAWALSLSSMTDLMTRAGFILLGKFLLKIGSHKIFIIGAALSSIFRIGMLWTNDKKLITMFIAIIGVPRCTIMVLMQVVVGDAVDQAKFSSAMGIFMLLFGIYHIILGPLIGAIRDMTNSYSVAFYILASCFGAIAVSWTIEIIYKKNKQKKRVTEDCL